MEHKAYSCKQALGLLSNISVSVPHRFPVYVPKVLCSEGSILRKFFIPKVLYMFWIYYVPNVHCYYNHWYCQEYEWLEHMGIFFLLDRISSFRADGKNNNWDSLIVPMIIARSIVLTIISPPIISPPTISFDDPCSNIAPINALNAHLKSTKTS